MEAAPAVSIDVLVSQATKDCRLGVTNSPSLLFFRDEMKKRGVQLSDKQCLLLSACSAFPDNKNPFNTPELVLAELGIDLFSVSTKFTPGDRLLLAHVATTLEAMLQARRDRVRKWKAGCEFGLRQPAEAPTTYEDELERELAAEAASVAEAKDNLGAARNHKSQQKLWHLVRLYEASNAVKEAETVLQACEARYQQAYLAAVTSANEAKCRARVAVQNQKAGVDAANRKFWKQLIPGCDELEKALKIFLAKAGSAILSAKSNDWFERQSHDAFVRMAQAALACNFQQAEAILGKLVFRQIPSEDFYFNIRTTAQNFLGEARGSTRGHAAVFGYPGIIDPTVQLACPGLVPSIPRKLRAGTNTARRWRKFETRLCSPHSFVLEPLWVYFWVMFAAGQALASDMGRRGSEDSLTFKLCAYIAQAAQWGEKLLPEFGYPTGGGNFIGTLGIAGEKPEHVTGADLGILVDIALGDVQVRKLALFQAKNSVNGRANVASRTDQLGKLSRLPSHGYYLFYHRQGDEVPVPSATVRRACDLLAELTVAGPLPEGKTSLRVNTCCNAWELASLVAFGLAQANSGHGIEYMDIDHAMQLMSPSADALELPRYLHVVALGGPKEPLLSRLIEYGYQPHQHDRGREPRRPAKKITRDGPSWDHEM